MAGKGVRTIVKKALTMHRRAYTSGPWKVTVEGHELGGTYSNIHATMTLFHYGTKMLEWKYVPSTGQATITGTWTGWGSVSDQTGVNAALSELGSPMRYSRDTRGGGPRVNTHRQLNASVTAGGRPISSISPATPYWQK